jgi:transposase
LAVILDLCSRFAVGWAMSERITDDLTLDGRRGPRCLVRGAQGDEHERASSMIDAARAYIRRGWRPVPVPFREKAPRALDWQTLRLDERTLAEHFNGQLSNVGVLLGEPSDHLVDIDLDVPAELDLHLILDNYGTHKTPMVHRWLARHPRYHLHFTPTSSSWLNLVERWFAQLTEKQIKRKAHRSTAEALESAITHHITLTNAAPKPFVWTKTADEILASIARFCHRISGSGH